MHISRHVSVFLELLNSCTNAQCLGFHETATKRDTNWRLHTKWKWESKNIQKLKFLWDSVAFVLNVCAQRQSGATRDLINHISSIFQVEYSRCRPIGFCVSWFVFRILLYSVLPSVHRFSRILWKKNRFYFSFSRSLSKSTSSAHIYCKQKPYELKCLSVCAQRSFVCVEFRQRTNLSVTAYLFRRHKKRLICVENVATHKNTRALAC